MPSHASQVVTRASAVPTRVNPVAAWGLSGGGRRQPVGGEPLISLAILSNQLDPAKLQRPSAELGMDRVLNVAPEVPVDEDPARVSAGTVTDISGILDNQRKLACTVSPQLKHPGVMSKHVGVWRELLREEPGETDLGARRPDFLGRGAHDRCVRKEQT